MGVFSPPENSGLAWDVLVFGHLFWNRYFGESADAPPRGIPSTCSSVLIRGKDRNEKPFCLIVDPSTRRSPEEFYFDLNRRTGLGSEAITHCFATHHHFDHWHGLRYFPNAQWLCGPGNKALIEEAAKQAKDEKKEPGDGNPPEIDAGRITEVEGEFLPGVTAIPLPGHTENLFGIALKSGGKRILAASDAVMTAGHYKDRTTEFQEDEDLKRTAADTIRNIALNFDIIIPGHDNIIVV